jgi:hypothetical protein
MQKRIRLSIIRAPLLLRGRLHDDPESRSGPEHMHSHPDAGGRMGYVDVERHAGLAKLGQCIPDRWLGEFRQNVGERHPWLGGPRKGLSESTAKESELQIVTAERHKFPAVVQPIRQAGTVGASACEAQFFIDQPFPTLDQCTALPGSTQPHVSLPPHRNQRLSAINSTNTPPKTPTYRHMYLLHAI